MEKGDITPTGADKPFDTTAGYYGSEVIAVYKVADGGDNLSS